MKLSASFKKNVIAAYGTSGEDWLERLPSVIELLKKRFQLTSLIPFDNLSYSFAAVAQREHGTPCVLKIVPGNCKQEAEALTYFQKKGSVELLDQEVTHGALLLEYLAPGTSLQQLFPKDDALATEITASIIMKLTKKCHTIPEGFPSLAEWFSSLYDNQFPELASEYATARSITSTLLSD